MNVFAELQIDILNRCNFYCKHCLSSSSEISNKKLTKDNIDAIFSTLREFQFEKITFSGGEPTLDISLINLFISFIQKTVNQCAQIGLISNGWFSKEEKMINQVIGELLKLNFICISIDKYHLEYISIDDLLLLKSYCDKKDIKTLFISRIEEPLDVIKIQEYELKLNTRIQYQYVFPFGRAKVNNIGFRNDYFTTTTKIIPDRCPLLNNFMFDLTVGFTSCCGDLLYESEFEQHSNLIGSKESLQCYLNSNFYHFLSQKNFLNHKILAYLVAEKHKIRSLPICAYCSYLFREKFI